MKTKHLLILMAAVLLLQAATAGAQTLLQLTNQWRYNHSGQDLGAAWKEPAYNDSAWPTGRGVFAQEDHPLVNPLTNTVLSLSNAAGMPVVTYYFRTHFTFTNNPIGVYLSLSNLVDDGIVAYLNGVEAFRRNMPAGPVNASTLATTNATEGVFVNTVFPPSTLFPGDNVLAVEIHQATTNDADVVFGLAMGVVTPPAIMMQPTNQVVPTNYPACFRVDIASRAPVSYQWRRNGVNIAGATNASYCIPAATTNHTGTYSVRVSNVTGSTISSNATLSLTNTVFNNPENFENGWGDWFAGCGVWQIGSPTNGPGRAYSGTNCMAVVLDGVYPNNVSCSLVSPWTNVPPASENPRLRFWHWYSIYPGGACNQRGDYAAVYAVKEDGTSAVISPEYYWNSDWTRASLDLTPYAGQRVRFMFYFYANCSGAYTGWFIDDVQVVTSPYTLAALDGFENGMGDWAPNRGNWQVGTPTNGPGHAYSGTNCAAIVLDGLYPNDVSSSLVSPWTTVPPADQNPRLRFWHWYSIYPGGACNQRGDFAAVYVLKEDGTSAVISPEYYWNSDWTRASLDLTQYAGQRVRFMFYFYANCSGAYSGWFIDDVEVVTNAYLLPSPENFESGMGDWAPNRGNWQVGTPTNGPGRAYSGTNCAAIVLDGLYPNDVSSSLISPWTTVPSADQNPRLRFWHWYSIYPGGACNQRGDYAAVYVLKEDGTAVVISPEYYWNSDWTRASLDLTQYAGQRVRFMFYFYANCSGTYTGWFIDDVEVVTSPYILPALDGFENGMRDWAPNRGNWQVGTPTNGPGRAYSGTNCAAIVLDGLYPNDVSSSLVSPWTTVPPADQNPRLRFWHWYSIYPGGACNQRGDYAAVYVLKEDGDSDVISPEYYWSSDWTRASLDLTQYAGQRVRFMFYFYANCSGTYTGWFIDDVTIEADLALTIVPSITRTQENVCLPLRASAGKGLVSLSFTLTAPSGNAENLVFHVNPPFTGYTFPIASNSWYFLLRTEDANAVWGDYELGRVCFSGTFAQSTFVPLVLGNIAAGNLSGPEPKSVGRHGRATLIANEPLLEAHRPEAGRRRVTLYGKPGATYEVLSATDLQTQSSALWPRVQPPVTLTGYTNDFVITNAPPGNQFFIAREVTP